MQVAAKPSTPLAASHWPVPPSSLSARSRRPCPTSTPDSGAGLHAAQVELAALTNPLEQWAQVIGAAVSNAGALGLSSKAIQHR